MNRTLLLFCAALLYSISGWAQGSRVYISPQITAGLAVGADARNGTKLDFGTSNRVVGLEVRGGVMLNKRSSIFTGVGFGLYRYGLISSSINGSEPDTVHTQSQQFVEIPLAVRFTTYPGRRNFKTRYYGVLGLKTCILNDARHDYHDAAKTFYDNGLNEESFNKVFVRVFAEGGLDIPMDFDSGILIGLSLSQGISRNMAADGPLGKSNYGMLVAQLSFGLRLGL